MLPVSSPQRGVLRCISLGMLEGSTKLKCVVVFALFLQFTLLSPCFLSPFPNTPPSCMLLSPVLLHGGTSATFPYKVLVLLQLCILMHPFLADQTALGAGLSGEGLGKELEGET